MTTYNTQNPLGSSDPRDLYDNAENLDQAVNAEADTFQDRLGKSRLTWAGVVKAGTGDPAIAVDAAARAEGAATRAEASAIAAYSAGNQFDNTSQGLTATVEGQYFLIRTTDPQVFDVYLNDSGTAVASGQFKVTDGSEAFDIVEATRVSVQLPNVLPIAEVTSASPPPNLIGATASRITVNGAYAHQVTAIGETLRAYWRVDASEFPSGLISGYLVVASRNAGGRGYLRIIQRDASGVQLSNDILDASAYILQEASSIPVELRGVVAVVPDASTVDLELDLRGAGRTCVVQSPMLADGGVPEFRLPVDEAGEFFNDLIRESTGTYPVAFDLPVENIPSVNGTTSLEAGLSDMDRAFTVSAFVSVASDAVSAFKIGEGFLKSGEVLRVELTVQGDNNNNPAFGLLFGNEEALRGFALRNNAQLLTLNWPNSTSTETGPAARPYVVGDRVVMDARLLGGSPGNYAVRYYVEYSDGYRVGPYDVEGIESVDEVWLGSRATSEWGDINVTRHSAPQYIDEWTDGQPGTSSANIVYVATTGDDNSPGTIGSPFRTISKGVASLPHGGVVEVAGGEYRESVTSSTPESIWIRSKKGERAYILGSNQLTLTKTAGYNQIYQAPLESKPVGVGGGRGEPVIFEWGTPSKPIPVGERHPLHRGKSHRLPYTEMFEAASLEDLDTSNGMWWWDSGVIYLSATDGSDASLKRYEARARPCLGQFAGGLRLSRLHLMFSSSYGAHFRGDATVTEDVVVLGSYHNGFYHQSGTWKSYRDESGGNGNDGFNGTVADWSGTDDSTNRITAFAHDPYGHDNADDGTSYHFRGDQTVYGGLFEYNSKADVIHVTGAAVTCFGTVARGTKYGFFTSTEPTGDASREFTSLRCVETKAIDNEYSYSAANGNVLECDNAVAVNPSIFGYAQSDDGVLVARNSKYTGDPAKMKDGSVEVINDGALT